MWVARKEVRDTGWRDISSAWFNVNVDGICHVGMIRRVGEWVDFYADVTTPTAPNLPNPWAFMTVTTGFKWRTQQYGLIAAYASNLAIIAQTNGNMDMFGPTAANRYRLNAKWSTIEAWPSTLPGTAL